VVLPGFRAAYYRSRIDLTTYKPAKDGSIRVAGTAKLGYDLGIFQFDGVLGKKFDVRYHDARAKGSFTASYVNATHPSAFDQPVWREAFPQTASGPWPTPPPLVNDWRVPLTDPPAVVQFMTVSNAYVVLGSGGPGWQVRFSGAGDPPPITTLSPAVNGVWTQNPCSGTSCTDSGDWQATIFLANGEEWAFGTDDWAPLASDSTDGSWQRLVGGTLNGSSSGALVQLCSYCPSL
jgi:hypothetical protein